MRIWLARVVAAAIVVAVGVATAVRFSGYETRQLRAELLAVAQEKQRLVEYAERLTRSTRVAQVEVLAQQLDAAGRLVTRLRWIEIAEDGALGEPRELEAHGELIYFDALVLKFEHDYVGAGDPQRATSLHLFRRIFGNQQAPDSAAEIGRAARPRLADRPEQTPFARDLWERFWQLAEDPALAAQYGVRVAQVEAPATRLKPGEVWEVFRDASGGLNLRKLGHRM